MNCVEAPLQNLLVCVQYPVCILSVQNTAASLGSALYAWGSSGAPTQVPAALNMQRLKQILRGCLLMAVKDLAHHRSTGKTNASAQTLPRWSLINIYKHTSSAYFTPASESNWALTGSLVAPPLLHVLPPPGEPLSLPRLDKETREPLNGLASVHSGCVVLCCVVLCCVVWAACVEKVNVQGRSQAHRSAGAGLGPWAGPCRRGPAGWGSWCSCGGQSPSWFWGGGGGGGAGGGRTTRLCEVLLEAKRMALRPEGQRRQRCVFYPHTHNLFRLQAAQGLVNALWSALTSTTHKAFLNLPTECTY